MQPCLYLQEQDAATTAVIQLILVSCCFFKCSNSFKVVCYIVRNVITHIILKPFNMVSITGKKNHSTDAIFIARFMRTFLISLPLSQKLKSHPSRIFFPP